MDLMLVKKTLILPKMFSSAHFPAKVFTFLRGWQQAFPLCGERCVRNVCPCPHKAHPTAPRNRNIYNGFPDCAVRAQRRLAGQSERGCQTFTNGQRFDPQ
jgi:hypothetical protein